MVNFGLPPLGTGAGGQIKKFKCVLRSHDAFQYFAYVQTTLMTKEIEDMNELERILDILQSIRDREGGRRTQQNNNSHHAEHNQNKNNNYRGYNNNVHRDNVNKSGCLLYTSRCV